MEAAYIAGIVDGEGTIGIKRQSNGKSYNGYICVVNTCKELLINLLDRYDRGSVSDCTSRLQMGNRVCWRWEVAGSHVVVVLKELLPFLFIKKEQAELVIDYYEKLSRFRASRNNPIPQWVLDERARYKVRIHQLNSPGSTKLFTL